MMKVLLTGVTGMLGFDIQKSLVQTGKFDIFGISRKEVRILDCKIISGNICDTLFLTKVLQDIQPDIIIHSAAIVNVDVCESNPEDAEDLHIKTTEILSSYNSGITRFIYISTDSVFNGCWGNYLENSTPSPLNEYARTKLEGERVSLKNNPLSLVLRTNIYGFHRPNSSSLVEWALENLNKDLSIKGFDDVYFNAIYTKQFSAILSDILLHHDIKGILNVAGDLYISKYQFLILLANIFNFTPSLIQKSSVNSIKFKAPRPNNTTLNTDLLKSITGNIPTLLEGVKELKKDLLNYNLEFQNDKI